MTGRVGKRALCAASCLHASSPSRLEEHPLDPEEEDEEQLESAGPLLRRPLESPLQHASLTRIPNSGRGAPRPPSLSTPPLRPNIAQAQVLAGDQRTRPLVAD